MLCSTLNVFRDFPVGDKRDFKVLRIFSYTPLCVSQLSWIQCAVFLKQKTVSQCSQYILLTQERKIPHWFYFFFFFILAYFAIRFLRRYVHSKSQSMRKKYALMYTQL